MAKNWTVGICNEKAGFLFQHGCDRPPQSECSDCAKPVCSQHSFEIDESVVCLRCREKIRQKRETRSRRSGDRDVYYDDDPYFYGGYYYGYGYMSHHGYRDANRDDPDDFTEADAASLGGDLDGEFESDMSES